MPIIAAKCLEYEDEVDIFEIEINDGVIDTLKSHDDEDECLHAYIQIYTEILDAEGIEVFGVFNTFLVCEIGIYLADYADNGAFEEAV